MKKITCTTAMLAGICCLMGVAYAEQITPAEQEHARQYLAETRQGVLDAVKGLSDTQWNFKPAPDRWSIAQIVEHLAITEEVVQTVFQKLPEAPAPSAERDPRQVDTLILAKVPDRSSKVQAPPPLLPTGRWTPQVALEHFLEYRQQTVSFLQSGSNLREHVIDHPVLGPLDGYQWVLTVAAHTERHMKQILEVKSDPHFPAK